MTRNTTVRESVLAKAIALGQEMARDPIFRPRIVNVLQYRDYAHFRIAHRAYWEQSTRFERYYQERVYEMADAESEHMELSTASSLRNWDEWYETLVQPIKHAMWSTWETQIRLQARYLETLLATGKATIQQFNTEVDVDAPSVESTRPKPPALMRMLGTLVGFSGFGHHGA